ncbi:MAG: ATP-dependent DNA helicase [bacterium]|nr:ATP-dependent DNA helicase [bacterium]
MTSSGPESLTTEQQQAVSFKKGACLVVAGAGTGKTRVLTHRVADLVARGVPAKQILALTFTEKAALEMQERIDQLLPLGTNVATITTFHSFTIELLRRYAHFLGISADFALLTTEEELVFIKEHLFELPLKILRPGSNPTKFLEDIIDYFNRLRDEAISSTELTASAKSAELNIDLEADADQRNIWYELADTFAVYDELLKNEGYLTFGHCITEVIKLFREHPAILAEIRSEYHYLMVDEYQDTNWAQTELAAVIAGPDGNIMAVGDDDQAIYRFRGAASANIKQFLTRYPKTTVMALTNNYRSTQEILDTAYRGIQHNNPDRLEFISKIDKRLLGQRKGSEPVFLLYDRLSSELLGISDQVQAWLNDGITPQEIAVLGRTRNQANKITFTLRQAGIAVNNPAAYRLYDHPLIAGIIAFGELLLNPSDNLAFMAALNQRPFNVPDLILNSIAQHRPYREDSLFDYSLTLVKQEPAWLGELAIKKLNRFFRIFNRLQKIVNERPSLLLLKLVHLSGLYAKLTQSQKPEALVDLERLGQLFEEAQAFEERHRHTNWRQFIQYLQVLIENEVETNSINTTDSDPFMVNVMTIHQSKGLEFTAVIVAHCSEGRFPSKNYAAKFSLPPQLQREKIGDSTHEAEERRLFYVATTRAKEHLLYTAAIYYGVTSRKAKVSRFIFETIGESAALINPQTKAVTDYLQLPLELNETAPRSPVAAGAPITISQTDLDTYLTCPYKYRYRQILKIKVYPSAAMNFGISIHNTLRAFFHDQKQGPTLDLAQLYQEYWISGGYESKKQEKLRYLEGLSALQQAAPELAAIKPDQIEWSFNFPLKTGDRVRGRIDRFDRHEDGTVSIVDYKTGSPKEEAQVRQDLQLGVYILAVETLAQKKVKTVVLDYIIYHQKVTVARADFALTKIIDQIDRAVVNLKQDLARNEFTAKPDKFTCQYCEFKSLCPFRYTG